MPGGVEHMGSWEDFTHRRLHRRGNRRQVCLKTGIRHNRDLKGASTALPEYRRRPPQGPPLRQDGPRLAARGPRIDHRRGSLGLRSSIATYRRKTKLQRSSKRH